MNNMECIKLATSTLEQKQMLSKQLLTEHVKEVTVLLCIFCCEAKVVNFRPRVLKHFSVVL